MAGAPKSRLLLATIVAANLVVATPYGTAVAIAQDKVSVPGKYEGYSAAHFDGVARTSRYIQMRDGTRIAIDIFRPTLHGKPVTAKLPVVWMNTPYNRRITDGVSTSQLYPGSAEALVKYGYVVAVADMRGSGASFGVPIHSNRTEWMPPAYWDAYDVTEWLAGQSWSDGNIGMWGCSATGHSQWQAAATAPPHLKAIFPMSAPSEYYDWGGIFDPDGMVDAGPRPGAIPARDATAVPVDDDRNGTMLAAALAGHRWAVEPGEMPYRDSVSPGIAKELGIGSYRYWLEASTLTHFPEIAKAHIPAYQSSSYGEDMRVRLGVLIKQRNLPGPMKTIMGPGHHCSWSSPYATMNDNAFDITVEEHRWFDRWLKGIRNGVEDEPPIYYYVNNVPAAQAWRYAWQWPLPNTEAAAYYFASDARNTKTGALLPTAPDARGGGDTYSVDYTVDENAPDAKSLTYTSAPLTEQRALTGSPIFHLWIRTDAPDVDFVGYIEDVAPGGIAHRLPGTDDGRLRASHRKLNAAPYDSLGLPYHRSFEEDVAPLEPGEPTELVFDMAPEAWVFAQGHRIRVAIANVAAAHHGTRPLTPVLSPPPKITMLHDAEHPSRIVMPMAAPVQAVASFDRSGGALRATIAFPPTVDIRYIADIKPDSVKVGGIAALEVHPLDNTLVVEFPASAATQGASLVTGEFGARYDYGPWMTFAATEAAGK